MAENDIMVFSCKGERILGVVIEHYTNPLDDFYVVYADYALHKVVKPDEDASILLDNVVIPALDCALSDYALKRQHLKDISKYHQDITAIMQIIQSKMDTNDIFDGNIT